MYQLDAHTAAQVTGGAVLIPTGNLLTFLSIKENIYQFTAQTIVESARDTLFTLTFGIMGIYFALKLNDSKILLCSLAAGVTLDVIYDTHHI